MKGFLFYQTFYKQLKDLDKETKLKFYDLIMEYAFNQKEPNNLQPLEKSLWIGIKQGIDNSISNYNDAITNGKKGAEKRWGNKQTTVEQTPQKETNKFLNPLMPTPKQIRDPLKNPQPNNDYIETQEELVEEEKEPQETTINYKILTIEEKEEIKEAREKQKLSNYKPTTPSFDKALKDLVDKANKMTT